MGQIKMQNCGYKSLLANFAPDDPTISGACRRSAKVQSLHDLISSYRPPLTTHEQK